MRLASGYENHADCQNMGRAIIQHKNRNTAKMSNTSPSYGYLSYLEQCWKTLHKYFYLQYTSYGLEA